MIDAEGRLALPWLDAPLAQGQRQRAHAVLVHGPSGVGQFELALALAQGWLCEADPAAGRACGRCTGCRAMLAHQHPDFLLLAPGALRAVLGWSAPGEEAADSEGAGAKPKAKPSRDIRVDEVRQAIAWTQQTSSRGRGKVLLLHPAQAMNAVAANALLKTLEEPPGRVRLLLTAADPEALLPTIRSRCQRLALAPPPRETALDWLAGRGVAEAEVLFDAAGGRPQEALQLHQEGFDAARWRRLPNALAVGDAGPLAGCNVARAVDALLKLCHDLMLAAAGAAPRYFPAASLPGGATLPALAAWARTLTRVARHDDHPWNAPLLLEALVSEGRRCFAAAPRDRVGTATLGRR
jgi:DNA polymerase-3 subunit delta'